MNDKDSGVYVIQEGDSNRYKIGKTDNGPVGRLSSLQTGNPTELYLELWIPCEEPELLEKELHVLFESHRLRGEWFELGEKEFEVLKTYQGDNGIVVDEETLGKYAFLKRNGLKIDYFIHKLIVEKFNDFQGPVKQDNLEIFLENNYDSCEGWGVPANQFMEKYCNWCKDNSRPLPNGRNTVYSELRSRGLRVDKGTGGRIRLFGWKERILGGI
jgi:hypothetical protein